MSFWGGRKFKKAWSKDYHEKQKSWRKQDDDDDHGSGHFSKWHWGHRRKKDDDDDHGGWKFGGKDWKKKFCKPEPKKCDDDDGGWGKGWKKKWVKCDPEPEPDLNTAPEITAPTNNNIPVAAFDIGVVADVDAVDADGDQFVFSLEGPDADRFNIDQDSGEIDLMGQPLSITGSAAGTSIYEVTVVVEDVPEAATDSLDLVFELNTSA